MGVNNGETHCAEKASIRDLLQGNPLALCSKIDQKEKAENSIKFYIKFPMFKLSFSDILKTLIFFFLFPPKGFLIYFAYGIRHSLEGNPRDEEDEEETYSDNIHATTEEKSAIQANDHHQRNLSLPFIFHEKTSEC